MIFRFFLFGPKDLDRFALPALVLGLVLGHLTSKARLNSLRDLQSDAFVWVSAANMGYLHRYFLYTVG